MKTTGYLGLLGAALLWSAAAAAQDGRAGDIEVQHPWLRLPPPVSAAAAAYMTLRNHGATADRLLEVRTTIAHQAMLHASVERDGVAVMEHLDAVELPAAGETRFEPGGLHVMVMGLREKLVEGASVAMTLRFERAGELVVEFPVRRAP